MDGSGGEEAASWSVDAELVLAVGVGSWFFRGLFDFSDVFVFGVGGAGSGDFVDGLGLSNGAGTSVWFLCAKAQGDGDRTSKVGWDVFVG